MMKEKINIVVNSTILYVIAFLLTTVFHEYGHAITGLINGSQPVLHHNYVEHLSISGLSGSKRVMIALAGPLTSLLQGVLIGLVYLKSKKDRLLRLFWLWLSVLGFSNFFGYLMTGPLFQEGDIGKVFLLLRLPIYLQILIAVIGMAILFFIAFKITRPFLKFSYQPEWLADPVSRKDFAFKIIILPWIMGALIVSILYLPVIALISIIYPFSSGMIFIFPWKNARHQTGVPPSPYRGLGEVSFVLYGLLAVMVFIFHFILAPGIAL